MYLVLNIYAYASLFNANLSSHSSPSACVSRICYNGSATMYLLQQWLCFNGSATMTQSSVAFKESQPSTYD
eukprot:scaffold745_cov167-Alexandrium_tamarense.AAC.4